LGYKPFLNLIGPQLLKLLEVPVDAVSRHYSDGEVQTERYPRCRCLERNDECFTSLGCRGASARPLDDTPPQPEEQEPLEEGSYDCTLS
ncbi:hypothetical protein cypCar_00050327, partial [Cyprinus carpio]